MIVECGWCERPFEAQRSSARFCSSTCRSRKSRAGGTVPPVWAVPPGQPGTEVTLLVELEAAMVLHLPAAQAALRLAHRLDHSGRSSAADVVALAKELVRLHGELLASSPAGSTQDELAVRRARRTTRSTR